MELWHCRFGSLIRYFLQSTASASPLGSVSRTRRPHSNKKGRSRRIAWSTPRRRMCDWTTDRRRRPEAKPGGGNRPLNSRRKINSAKRLRPTAAKTGRRRRSQRRLHAPTATPPPLPQTTATRDRAEKNTSAEAEASGGGQRRTRKEYSTQQNQRQKHDSPAAPRVAVARSGTSQTRASERFADESAHLATSLDAASRRHRDARATKTRKRQHN